MPILLIAISQRKNGRGPLVSFGDWSNIWLTTLVYNLEPTFIKYVMLIGDDGTNQREMMFTKRIVHH